MKNVLKVLSLLLVVMAFGKNAHAQATATATATATIVTPISISRTAHMNFGNVAVNASGLGTVILAPAGTRTSTGGVTLPATAGTVTAAAFSVAGTANYGFSITLPSSAVTLTRASSTETMTATTFTSSSGSTGTLNGSGAATFTVGATLNVAAAQVAGVYTSGNFDVTVNYN